MVKGKHKKYKNFLTNTDLSPEKQNHVKKVIFFTIM